MSITVAQRAREFALVRMIGGSRRQILRSVILEALVIGLLASVVGLLVGVGLASGLNALFAATGADLPDSGLVFKSADDHRRVRRGRRRRPCSPACRPRGGRRAWRPSTAFREGVLGPTRPGRRRTRSRRS